MGIVHQHQETKNAYQGKPNQISRHFPVKQLQVLPAIPQEDPPGAGARG